EEQEKVVPATMQRSAGSKQNNTLKEAMPKIIVALFIIMIFVIVYTLLKDKAADLTIDGDAPGANSNVVTDPQPDPIEIEKQKQPFEHASTSGETSIYKLSDPETIKVVIKTTGNSWISVTDQNGEE